MLGRSVEPSVAYDEEDEKVDGSVLIRSMCSRIISAELYPVVDPSTSKRVEEGWNLGRHGSHLFRNDATGLYKLGFKLQCSITRVAESLFLLTLQLHHTLLKKKSNSCILSNTNCLQMAEDVLALQMPSDHAVCVYSTAFITFWSPCFYVNKIEETRGVKLASNTLIEAIFARRLCSIWSLAMWKGRSKTSCQVFGYTYQHVDAYYLQDNMSSWK